MTVVVVNTFKKRIIWAGEVVQISSLAWHIRVCMRATHINLFSFVFLKNSSTCCVVFFQML